MPHGNPFTELFLFRFREDDNGETNATWREPTNFGTALDTDTNYRIRWGIKNTGDGAESNLNGRQQYRINGGSWNNVASATSVVISTDSTHYADADDTTRQITSGLGGTFDPINDGMSESDGIAGGNNCDPQAGGYMEFEFCFQIVDADVEDGDYIELQVEWSGGAAYDDYEVYAGITVRKRATQQPLIPYASIRGGNFFNKNSNEDPVGTAAILKADELGTDTWLFCYSAAFGSTGSFTNGFVLGSTDIAKNQNPSGTSGDDPATSGGILSGFYIGAGGGSDDCYQEILDSSSSTSWYANGNLLAFPLNDWNVSEDYWYEQHNSDTNQTTVSGTTWTDIDTLTFTPPEEDPLSEYLLLVSTEFDTDNTSDEVEVRLTIDDVVEDNDSYYAFNATDKYHSWSRTKKVTLTAGQSTTIAVEGRNSSGSYTAGFRRTRIIAIKVSSFGKASNSFDSSITFITANYPSYDNVSSLSHTTRDDSMVAIFASTKLRTGSTSTQVAARLRDNTNSKDHQEPLGALYFRDTADYKSISLFAAKGDDAATAISWYLDGCLEAGDSDSVEGFDDRHIFCCDWQKAIVVDHADLTLTGHSPHMDFGFYPASGALTLSTTAPIVVLGVAAIDIEVPTVDLVLSEEAPAVEHTRHHYVTVPADDLDLTTVAPVRDHTQHHFVTVPADDLVLDSVAPTIVHTQNHFVVPPAADLDITTVSPDVDEHHGIDVPHIDMLLEGFVPLRVHTQNHARAPPHDDLALTTTIPTCVVSENISITVPSVDLSIEGHYPYYKQIILYQTDGLSRGTVVDLASATGNSPAILPSGLELTEFGTPGTKANLVSISGGSVPYDGVVLQTAPGEPGEEHIDPGVWKIPFNVTQANSNITLKECRVYTYDPHAGVVDTLLASDTNLGISLATTGVKDIQMTGIEGSHLRDLIIVIFTFVNTGVLPEEFAWLADQPILGPLFRRRIVRFPATVDIDFSTKSPNLSYVDNVMPASGGMGMGNGGGHHRKSIKPPSGAMAFSNQIPTVEHTEGTQRTVPADDLLLSTTAPVVQHTQNHFITVPSDDLVITTQPPVVVAEDNVAIEVPADDLALSTLAPIVAHTQNHFVTVPADDLVITTQPPTSTESEEVPAAQLTLTGTPPVVLHTENHFVTVPADDLVLDTTAPIVVADANISIEVPADDLSISTLAPVVAHTENHFVTVPAGDLAISTLAPTVIWTDNHFVTVPNGDLLITGTAPQLGGTVNITVPAADLSFILTTVAPGVRESIQVPADDLVLSTTAPSTSINFSFEIPTGDLDLSSVAPSAGTGIGMPAGDLFFTTTAPNVAVNFNITVPWVDLTLTGSAPTVARTANIAISVPAGDLALSTTAPALGAGENITTPAGDLALTGTVPSVVTTANIAIAVPAGDLALSTTAPQLGAGTVITVPAGDLALTGVITGVSIGVVIGVPAGDLALTGSIPQLGASFAVTVPAADLALSSVAPSVVFSAHVAITVPTADLTLSTTAPDVFAAAGADIEVPTADLVLSTTAPSVEIAYLLTVPAADLALTTQSPIVLVGYLRIVPSTDLTISLQPPTVRESIQPPAADLDLSTQAPEISQPIAVSVPTGNLAFSSTAPEVAEKVSITVPTGELSLVPTAPQIGGEINITVPTTDLVLSGQIPGVSRIIEIPKGDLSLSTALPSVRISVEVPSGNIQITTTAPLVAVSISSPSATLGLTTAAPSVVVGFNLAIPSADLAISTFAPVAAPSISPPAAQLNLTTETPSVRPSIAVPAADLAIEGFHPSAGEGLSPPQVHLTLSGSAPTVEIDTPITIPVVDLTITTVVPGISLSITVPAADLTLTGYAPTLFEQVIITVPTADLVLSGQVPDVAHAVGVIVVPAAQLSLTTVLPTVAQSFKEFVRPPAAQLVLSGQAVQRSVLPYRAGLTQVESCEPIRTKISHETQCVGSPLVTGEPCTDVDTEV